MFLSERETAVLRDLIIRLYTSPFDQDLLIGTRKTLCQLTDSQYFSLICFLKRPNPSCSKVFSNNPPGYQSLYFSIMSEDFLLHNLLPKAQEEYIMARNPDYVAPENKHFTQIATDARPVTDIAYFKLHTDSVVNGIWAFAKNSKTAPGFSDFQLNIMRFIVPFLTDAFNRACIPPPVPEDVAYLDTKGHILDAGSRIQEAFDDLFGRQLLVNANSQKRILQNTFLQHYARYLHGPLSPSIDKITLSSEKKTYTFLFSILHPRTIVLDSEGFPLASARLLGTALSMNSIQRVNIPLIAQRFGFTRRECDVLLGIYRGESNKIIARNLGVDESTIKRHTHNIYEKSGFRSRLELVVGLSER